MSVEADKVGFWYFGGVRRDDCEKLLSPYELGKFIIRDSYLCPGLLVLSLCAPAKDNPSGLAVFHYLIRKVRYAWNQNFLLTLDGKHLFSDLLALVKHYRDQKTTIACRLTWPPPEVKLATCKAAVKICGYENLPALPKFGRPVVRTVDKVRPVRRSKSESMLNRAV